MNTSVAAYVSPPRQSTHSKEELDWLKATEVYQKKTGKAFLSRTDYLRIAQEMGYVKIGLSS